MSRKTGLEGAKARAWFRVRGRVRGRIRVGVRVGVGVRARVRARVRVMVRVRVRVRATSVPQRVAQPRECLGRRGRRGGHHGNSLLPTETNAAELIVCDKADARGACWVRRRRGKALGSPAPPRGVITR